MIALDSNTFIYMLEGNAEFGGYARELFTAVERRGLAACTSELTFMEVLSHTSLSTTAAKQAQRHIEDLGVRSEPVSKKVLTEAARLRRECGLGALDAIHVASALMAGCPQFVTNDQQLLKRRVPKITLVALTQIREAVLRPGLD